MLDVTALDVPHTVVQTVLAHTGRVTMLMEPVMRVVKQVT